MTDKNKTLIVVILDRSGSMTTIQSDMVGGFNEFIAKQRKAPGETLVSLYRFDSEYEVVYENIPVKEVPGLVLEPRDSTALLDAIGRTTVSVGAQLRALPEEQRPGAVIVVVITDGHENSSHEYNRAQIRQMIETQEKAYSWQFVYLGAGEKAFQEAQSMGFSAGKLGKFETNNVGTRAAYSSLQSAVQSYSAAVACNAVEQEFKLSATQGLELEENENQKSPTV